jgi:alkylation response protein AidB-like acyl-CoA dehydrogenase
MVIELIKQFGSEAQRAKYLPLLATGEILGTLAYFEADSLEPFLGTQAKVSNKALSGVKNLVVNAGIAQLVLALASEEVKENQPALGFWLIENSGKPKVSVSASGPYIGLRSAYLEKLELTGYPIKEDDCLGGLDGSGEKAKQAYDFALSVGKTIMAATAVGMLEELLGHAAKKTQQGELRGSPANQSQGLQWRLADVATETSAGRLLTYRAAWSKDEDGEEFLKYSAMCKLFTAKAARIHSSEAMQVLGLLATAADSHAERTYRDAKMFELCLGSNDEERVLLGRELGI